MSSPATAPIVCHTTPWYTRRAGIIIFMFTAFCGWFFYDGKFAYPAKKEIYEKYVSMKDKDPAGWKALAIQKLYPAQPEEMDDAKIRTQLQFSVLTGVAALSMLARFLYKRRQVLTADGTSFTAPSGEQVPFSKIFRLDRTKWQDKGLATVFYRDEAGQERKTVIDDFMYGGADQVLDRVRANFEGEDIGLADDPAAASKEDAEPAA